jgi:hypothetical protein
MPNLGWGKFTPNQKKILPERLAYLGLLLYEFSEEERHQLKNFAWQLCKGESIETTIYWLKSSKFPSRLNSSEIIQKLGNGEIGTDDKQILEHIIRPTGKSQFDIRIYWDSDKQPPNSLQVALYSMKTIEEQQKVQVLLTRK